MSGWPGRYVTLPGYIGAMLVAAVLRNVADATKLVRIEARVVDAWARSPCRCFWR